MDLWNVVAGGAAVGLIAGFWNHIKAVLWRVASLFVIQIEVPTEAAHNAIVAYLIKHHKRSRLYDRMYGAIYEHQRDGRYGLIPYEAFGHRGLTFWVGWFPLWFNNESERKAKGSGGGQQNQGNDSSTKVFSTLTFFRGTVDVERILREACAELNAMNWAATAEDEKAKARFVIRYFPSRGGDDYDYSYGANGLAWYQQALYRLLSHTPEQLGKGSLHRGKALTNLIFPRRIKDLIKEIELWRNNRQWYLERGIPWKRGWLLYGPPGTGKTALARAFAEDLNMPIYVFNLAEMSNHELIKAWSEMQVNVPCIALIEDIDNVFHGRENVSRKHAGLMGLMIGGGSRGNDNNDSSDKPRESYTPLTFDCLLNCLDGVERSDGIFTIITTNDIAKVDPALGQPRKLPDGTVEFISTRPGRIDKAVELTFMEPEDKKLMAQRILGDYPEPYRKVLAFIERYPDLLETPAQFQERCAQVALACFWAEQQGQATQLLTPLEPVPESGEIVVPESNGVAH